MPIRRTIKKQRDFTFTLLFYIIYNLIMVMSSVKISFFRGKNRLILAQNPFIFTHTNHNYSVFLLRKNGFAAGLLSGTCHTLFLLQLLAGYKNYTI